jgi:hypothetical protein
MKQHNVDCLFLNDARNLAGDLDVYQAELRNQLPDCRLFQFPTTRVHTNSRTEMNNRMGGSVAIVSNNWAGFVITGDTYTDPMGLGILNSLSFCARNYRISVLNAYFPPTTGSSGPATLNTSIARYQNRPTMPTVATRQSPNEFVRGLTQKLLLKRRAQGYTVILTGDLNETHNSPAHRTFVNAAQLLNPLHTAFGADPCFHTRNANSQAMRNTAIDHVLHTPLPDSLVLHQVGVLNTKRLLAYADDSDHLPVWISLTLTRPFISVPLRKPLPSHPRCDITPISIATRTHGKGDHWDDHVLYNQQIMTHLRRLPSRSSPQHGNCIAALLRLSVETVETGPGLERRRKARPRSHKVQARRKHGYSPAAAAITAHLEFYVNLLATAFPPGRHRSNSRWRSDTYRQSIAHYHARWNRRHEHILKQTAHHPLVARLEPPGHLAYLSFHTLTPELLRSRIRTLKTHVHAKRRNQLRSETNSRIQHIEELRATKQLGKLIELLSGAPQQQLDLQTLPSETAGLITDHYEIQRHLNTYFTDWLAIPDDLDPAADHMTRHPLYWQSLLNPRDPTNPRPLHQHSRIPISHQKGLRRVCAKKVSAEVEQLVRAAENAPITFADFDRAIDDLSNGGAPGPSNATANMVKNWNTEVREYAYRHMQGLWELREHGIPQWIKDKKIKLAPKVPGNSDLKNMRPISLYEVIRKVWTTTVAKRIHRVLHDANVLHAGQGGYRHDQGTMMPILRVINRIEGAIHTDTATHLTFWDIKRAFDSIPRSFQLLAWTRMGVSISTAQWFVQMDDGGLSFLDTPLYAHTQDLHSHTNMHSGRAHMSKAAHNPHMSFAAGRGIGQGESASSLQWVLLYDILLEWIDPRNRHLHVDEQLEPYDEVAAQSAAPVAYADDLTTCSSGPKAQYLQQLQADWLSSFCAFTGLRIHPDKIRATIVGKVHPMHAPKRQADGTLRHPSVLTVHDHAWRPIHCPIDVTMQTYKYLGVHLDLRGKPAAACDRLRTRAAAAMSNLLLQPGSPQAKISYVRFKIMPEILYTAQVANWSLAQYRTLDKPFSDTYKKLLSLPRKSPATMLYLPTNLCGVGLPRVSDLAQRYKWNNLLRCQALGGSLRTCMNQLLNRVPGRRHPRRTPIRILQPVHQPGDANPRPYKPGARYLARSLLEWTAEAGIVIAQRYYEDPQTLRDQEQNCVTIERHAQRAELWPNEEWFGAEQELRDVKNYFTDGSFRIKPRNTADILASEHDIKSASKGAGGIVIMPRNPHDPVLGFHVTSEHPLPGMCAYTWELLTQVVGLHLMKYMPNHVHGYSDCEAAITRSNSAMTSLRNLVSHTKAGILTSGAFQFRPAEVNHPDRTMKRADPGCPRTIHWIRSHPEKDSARYTNPSELDKGIFMADILADSANAPIKSLGNTRLPPVLAETLSLTNIMDEIIPLHEWHFRAADNHNLPILDDPIAYQQRAQLHHMTTTRDNNNNEHRWSSTALAFTAVVHPPKNTSYWAAARRAVIIFDWMGHGRNRAKPASLTPLQKTQIEKCTRCQRPDSQQHIILECSHPPFNAIRCSARTSQALVASKLCKKHHRRKHRPLRHLITTFISLCWRADTPDLSRYWLGTWTADTLATVLPQPLTEPMTRPQRALYISTVRALTKPLLTAFDELLRVAITHRPTTGPPDDPLPLLDHLPPESQIDPAAPHCTQPIDTTRTMPSLVSMELAAMYRQDCPATVFQGPTLHCTYSNLV